MMANGRENLEKVQVLKCGQMEQDIRDNGETTRLMDMENLFMSMGIFTKVNGLMIKHKGKELITTTMVLNMKDNGNKISSMDMGMRLGQIIVNIKAIIKWVERVE